MESQLYAAVGYIIKGLEEPDCGGRGKVFINHSKDESLALAACRPETNASQAIHPQYGAVILKLRVR